VQRLIRASARASKHAKQPRARAANNNIAGGLLSNPGLNYRFRTRIKLTGQLNKPLKRCALRAARRLTMHMHNSDDTGAAAIISEGRYCSAPTTTARSDGGSKHKN
jgi:hypothetical protein